MGHNPAESQDLTEQEGVPPPTIHFGSLLLPPFPPGKSFLEANWSASCCSSDSSLAAGTQRTGSFPQAGSGTGKRSSVGTPPVGTLSPPLSFSSPP